DVRELLADIRMVVRLEEVRLLQTRVKDGRFDDEGADREYDAAFRDYGIDVEALELRQAAASMKTRPIRVELAAALDGWSQTRRWYPRRGGKSWHDLRVLSGWVDPDPRSVKVRNLAYGGDRQALLKWATSSEVRALPPVTLVRLAESLKEMRALREATVLLRQAQAQYPGDFCINPQLACSLTELETPPRDEVIRFYTAAVAIRPESPGARLNLGNALAGKGRLDEAFAAYRRAVELMPGY